ncbi:MULTISPECIES: LytTR family DNA-binding domain-containing protein [unclassified Flavobacterium]|uniref:LytR/AlgR family response regulator transcription factor n=1 Tax=unclassified Flavobacterium TaxID=196869 RepID=UPI002222BF12|nr:MULTISPECIES: LytTR family DNA-binding domain-containing protein [unclassified Flavobacterium]
MDSKVKKYILISSFDKVDFIKTDQIICCIADGRYTSIFTLDGKQYVACQNLGKYESDLGDEFFFRIHQSYIVNIAHVNRIKKNEGFFCEMTNNMRLPISNRKHKVFCEFIGLK